MALTASCITVIVCELGTLAVILDLPARRLYVSAALTVTQRHDAVRDVLAAAGVRQHADLALCACGEPLPIQDAPMTG